MHSSNKIKVSPEKLKAVIGTDTAVLQRAKKEWPFLFPDEKAKKEKEKIRKAAEKLRAAVPKDQAIFSTASLSDGRHVTNCFIIHGKNVYRGTAVCSVNDRKKRFSEVKGKDTAYGYAIQNGSHQRIACKLTAGMTKQAISKILTRITENPHL